MILQNRIQREKAERYRLSCSNNLVSWVPQYRPQLSSLLCDWFYLTRSPVGLCQWRQTGKGLPGHAFLDICLFLLLFYLLSGGNGKGAHIFTVYPSASYFIDVASEQRGCHSQPSHWHQSASLRKRGVIDKWCGDNWVAMWKKNTKKLEPQFTFFWTTISLYLKLNSRWLRVLAETMLINFNILRK